MGVMQREVIIAAGGSDSNLIDGSAFELPRVPSLMSCGVTASVTGGFITITTGSQIVLEESPPVVNATLFPRQPDEMYYNDIVMPGDRIVISARNPTGGNITFRPLVILQPLQGTR